MKQVFRKRMIQIAIVVSLVIGSLWLCNRILVLKREDGITSMQNYYAQKKNTVDVLILGTSHAGTNIDIEILWKEHGYSTYSLWGSMQPFWNSYYFLQEALKTQQPKVVILDVYAATYDTEYSDHGRQVTNTAGMKFNWNRWQAVKASAPKEEWLNLMFGLPNYHARYNKLDKEDFQHFPWSKGLENQKGGSVRYGSYWVIDTNYQAPLEVKPIVKKEEEYLRKIITDCKNRDIPLILVLTPTEHELKAQGYINYVRDIAKEEEVPFFDMNQIKELGLETDDYSIDNSHLNTYGARKVAHYLGDILSSYNLEDHRNDERYHSWDIYAQASNHEFLTMITEWNDYRREIERNGYGSIVFKGKEEEISGIYEPLKTLSPITVLMDDSMVQVNGNEITIDGNLSYTYQGDWAILTYDYQTHEVIEVAEFQFEGDYLFRK